MTKEEKSKIVQCMLARIATGFQFIEDNYLTPQRSARNPDSGRLRNVYILFSFYFEILLKSALVLFQSFVSKNEINTKLTKLRHKIDAIGAELGDVSLKTIGIKSISLQKGEYLIKTTDDKKIYVKDFNDIRYDFIECKVRKVPANEDIIIKESLNAAFEILKKIKYKHFKK